MDRQKLPAKRQGDSEPSANFDAVSLVVRQRTPVHRLPGFVKGTHRVPQDTDRRAQEFVARLGASLIRSDLDAAFDGFRQVLELKRRELQVTESEEGFGAIQTPHFLYSNAVFQSDQDANQAIWQREISQITAPEVLKSARGSQLFDGVFDTVEFVPPNRIGLADLIDYLEDREDPRITTEYDRGLSYCRIGFAATTLSIVVTASSFQVVYEQPCSPKELLNCLEYLREELVDFRQFA